MSDLISRQALEKAMYHEAFETDSDMQKWDSGCWIRYKMFENVVGALPPAQPELIEKAAYIRGFEQGRTQGMIDSQAEEIAQPKQPERDIPMKPNETIDSSWGIRKKQAVCPKCDYYLNRIYFLGDSKNKKVAYCETCGQAIDWEGWGWEEE